VADELTSVEEVPWEQLWESGRIDWQPGQHWSIIGPSGTGKTTGLVDLGERSMHHSILVITKNRDSLVRRLPTERGWTVARELADVQKLLKKSWGDRWEKRDRPPQRIVFHPKLGQVSLRDRAEVLAARVEELFTWVYYNGHDFGGVTVEIDEATGASQQLGLQKPLTLMWDESRSNDVEMVAGIQRPAYVPKSSYNAARYLMVFKTVDPDDVLAVTKMAGFSNRQLLRDQLEQLPEHNHLLISTREGWVVRSRVVIRKRTAVR
jgi:hypothetical protein